MSSDWKDRTFPLARFVERVRFIARDGQRVQRVDRLPDGRAALVLRVIEPDRLGDVMATGPRRRALLKKRAPSRTQSRSD